jgi:hypothetical protein
MRHVALIGQKRNSYKVLVGKPEVRRWLGRPKCKWKDNIKMDLPKIGWESMDWIQLAEDEYQWQAPMYRVMNLWVS